MTGTDTPCIVSSWIQAIRDLRHWHAYLNRVINGHALAPQQLPDRQRAIADLIRLRLELDINLQKLLSGTPLNLEADPLTHLNVHTNTILEWTRKIQQALETSGFKGSSQEEA